MKKYIVITMIALLSQVSLDAAIDVVDKLHEAVGKSDLKAVKKCIRRLGLLDAKEKAELLQEAQDILEEHESHTSLSSIGTQDLAKAAGGLIFTIAMAFAAKKFGTSKARMVRGLVQHDDPDLDDELEGMDEEELRGRDIEYTRVIKWLPFLTVSGLSLSGLYVAAQGLLCTSAKGRVAVARKIVDEINKIPVIGGEKDAVAPIAAGKA